MERKRDFSWLKKNWRVLTLCGGCVFAGFLVGMLIFGSPWHLPPAWGDIPTWIIAIATLGLLIGAIITAVYAARAFGTQTEEVGLLIEERKREVDERRKAQAAQIFTGAPRPAEFGTVPYARNASDSPIYDAQFWYSDLPDPDDLGMIPPGEEISGSGRVISSSAENAISDLILTFRDAAGFQWIRMPDGALSEQSRPTARESVQAAREPSLPTGYERLDDEITGSVADAIVVYPRSHGELRMPGEFSVSGKLGVKENRQPEHEVTVISDDGSTQGVYTRWRRIGPPERFTAVYDVWNYRDSRVLARITLTGQADR